MVLPLQSPQVPNGWAFTLEIYMVYTQHNTNCDLVFAIQFLWLFHFSKIRAVYFSYYVFFSSFFSISEFGLHRFFSSIYKCSVMPWESEECNEQEKGKFLNNTNNSEQWHSFFYGLYWNWIRFSFFSIHSKWSCCCCNVLSIHFGHKHEITNRMLLKIKCTSTYKYTIG